MRRPVRYVVKFDNLYMRDPHCSELHGFDWYYTKDQKLAARFSRIGAMNVVELLRDISRSVRLR